MTVERIISVRKIDGVWTVTFISRRGITMTARQPTWEAAMGLANLAADLSNPARGKAAVL